MRRLPFFLLLLLTTSSFSQNPYWQHLDSTYDETVSAMTVTPSGHIFACFAPGRIYRSTDSGLSWTMMWDSTINTIVHSLVIDSSGDVFAATSTRTPGPFGTYVGRLIRSTDNGASWRASDSGMAGVTVEILAINRFNAFFAGSYNGKIYRSMDSGRSWVLVRSGSIGDNMSSFMFDSNDYIYTASFSGDSGGHVYRSSDNGTTWTFLAAFGRSIYSLAVDAGGTMYAGTYDASSTHDGGIFRSTNYGNAWSQVGLQNTSVSSLLVSGSNLFAATYGSGVYQSTNSGMSWNSVSSGLTNLNVRILCIAPNGLIFAGTYGGGVFRSSQPLTAIGEFGNQTAEMFSLKQNYPNPFNPTTTIRFEIAERSHVLITVFDILGREVSRPIDQTKPPGTYVAHFDARNLSSGIYYYRLQAGTFVETRKMLLIR